MGEFDLIRQYLTGVGAIRADVPLAVGDDAALVSIGPDQCLALCADAIVVDVHFPASLDAASVGHRALAVNLSDLAAMGATPAWALLTLTLPSGDEHWVAGFARGFDQLAREHGVQLVGGDTTAGPLTASVTAAGHVPCDAALRRSGARVGDLVYVSGTPGDAAAGLACVQQRLSPDAGAAAALIARFERPTPRVALGKQLRGLASACIDVSDGLAGDLDKLCAASGVAVDLDARALPLSAALRAATSLADAQQFALHGGDDYELLFTVPPDHCAAVDALAGEVAVTCIGRVVAETPGGARVTLRGAEPEVELRHGFDHFATPGPGAR